MKLDIFTSRARVLLRSPPVRLALGAVIGPQGRAMLQAPPGPHGAGEAGNSIPET